MFLFYRRTPIHYAAMMGAQISSNWLTKEGAKVEGEDHLGNEPFQHSILNRNIAVAVDYINQGVDVKHPIYDYRFFTKKSSFRHVLEAEWMGVAYLMVSRGVEITLAVQDALETENYQLAKTLLYKTQAKNLHNRTEPDGFNLHHIVSKYKPESAQSTKAFEDPWSVKIVEILDEHSVESKVYDEHQMTPLHYAVSCGHVNLARYYIQENKLNPEKTDGLHKERPLVTALYNGDEAMIKMLVVDIEVDVQRSINSGNTRDDGNRYPVHICISRNNFEITKLLLNHGASVRNEYECRKRWAKMVNGDRTVLHTAVRHRNHKMAKLLIDHKADILCPLFFDDLRGYVTAFHLACYQRDTRMIELLIEHIDEDHVNCPLKYSSIQPLDRSSEAATAKDKPRWRREFKLFHDKDAIDASALHIVCRRFGDIRLTELLLKHKADVNAKYREKSLLNRKRDSKTLRQKFKINVDDDVPDLCLLHSMVRRHNVQMVELLLRFDANPNISMSLEVESDGETVALHSAVRQGAESVVDSLLKSRARPDIKMDRKRCKNSDWIALHTAIRTGNSRIVGLLLRAGSESNYPMISENSAFGEKFGIHLGVQSGNIEIVRQLLKHGSDPNKKLNLRRTKFGDVVPLHLAVRAQNYEMVQLLLLFGADPDIMLRPKKEDEVIWRWTSDSGYKEYDDELQPLIENQYQSYLEQKKLKQQYLEKIEKANINLVNKRKPDKQKVEDFDNRIKQKSKFSLRRGSYFERHSGYSIDFRTLCQVIEVKGKHKRRKVQRYQHPEDPHKDGGSALWMAVRDRQLHIVSLLVDYHCGMNLTNCRGETALTHCIKNNDLTMSAILLRGAVYYHFKYKEKVLRGIRRRTEHLETAFLDDDDDDDDDGDYVMKTKSNRKKRGRSESGSPSADSNRRKKLKLSTDAKFVDGAKDSDSTLFVPVDVCLKDDAGFSALHHCVMTDGHYNASFENVTMMELLVKGTTARTEHFLETKVHENTPFKRELTEQEQKETNFAKPTPFESARRSVDLSVKDNEENDPMFYAEQQSSRKMKKCLIKLGAKEMMTSKATKALKQKLEHDAKNKVKALQKLYGKALLNQSYQVLADARMWRKEYFIEEDEEGGCDAEKVEVDFPAKKEIGKKGYVLSNAEDGAFNWDGLYVNVDKGKYGAYMLSEIVIMSYTSIYRWRLSDLLC